MTTHYGFCNFCDAICGLEIEHDGPRILSIRGDQLDPFSRGYVCPKGIAQQDIHADPDRLRRPIRKRGSDWEEVGWEEAFEEVGERCAAIQKKHGNDGLALYFGNPISHNYAAMLHLLPFAKGLQTRNVYSSGSVDAFSRMLVSQLLYGTPAALPVPDIERTSYFLILGANPLVSNGSIMTAPDCKRRLRELRGRGGRIVVIDPRRTETAEAADEHHFIEPDTDALFLAALLHVLFEERLDRASARALPLQGIERLAEFAAVFAPEAVAARTGIDASAIRHIARELAAADGAAVYGRMGTSVQSFGTLATWLADMVNIVSGNMDRAGGTMFSTPAVDLVGLAGMLGQSGSFGAFRSRVLGLRELNGELPVAAMYSEMATPGPGQIRGLLTLSANVVLSIPNGGRVGELLDGLEFMACVDIYLNETTRHADIILPPVSSLECDHYPLLEHAMAVRNTAHFAPAMLARGDDSRHDWEILTSLAESIGRHKGGAARLLGFVHSKAGAWLTPRRLLDLLLRIGPHKLRLAELERHPHGMDLGPLEPRLAAILGKRSIDLVPEPIADDFARLRASIAVPQRARGELRLIGRRTLRSMNSWLHNTPRLVSGSPRCVAFVHPRDAAALGLDDGDRIVLSTGKAQITVPARITDEVMPGVVSLPYGWGHSGDGTRQTVAAGHGSGNYNDLVDEGGFDPVSGASVLNGIAVRVRAAAGQERDEEKAAVVSAA